MNIILIQHLKVNFNVIRILEVSKIDPPDEDLLNNRIQNKRQSELRLANKFNSRHLSAYQPRLVFILNTIRHKHSLQGKSLETRTPIVQNLAQNEISKPEVKSMVFTKYYE